MNLSLPGLELPVQVAVLDLLESELCVDVTREYATGQSNGAIYTFHLGSTLSSRLAAIAPISGSFMHDYIKAPTVPMPVPLTDVNARFHGFASCKQPAAAFSSLCIQCIQCTHLRLQLIHLLQYQLLHVLAPPLPRHLNWRGTQPSSHSGG